MAIRHRWQFTAADPETTTCGIDGCARWDAQCGSNVGTRNSGGTTTSATTPDRVTAATLGGYNMARLRTITGDAYISGSNQGYRCDMISTLPGGATSAGMTGSQGVQEGQTRVYFLRLAIRPATDYVAAGGTWNGVCFEFHNNASGWPGGQGLSLYVCNGDPGSPWNTVSSGQKIEVGDLAMEMYGGTVPTSPFSPTPSTINAENWMFLKKGQWENKMIEIAVNFHWASNRAESSGQSYYYKDVHGGTGTPTDLTNSGYLEFQYRIGTIGASSVTWGSWTWFDGGTVNYSGGGKQVWANGGASHPSRHYRPTSFWRLDTNSDLGGYWKLHHYHNPNSADSSIYIAEPTISDTYADLGLSDPSGATGGGGTSGVTLASIVGATANIIGVPTADGSTGSYLGDLLNYKRVTPSRAVVPADADNFTVGYEYGRAVTSSATRKMVVYALDGGGGAPGTLIATSSAVTTAVGSAAWIAYPFPQTSLIAYRGLKIGIGTIQGSGDNTFETWRESLASSQFLRLDSYGSGPSAAWAGSVGGGFTGTYPNELATALLYNVAAGADPAPAPLLQTAYVIGSTLQIHYDIPLDTTAQPDLSSFAVKVNGVAQRQPVDKVVYVGATDIVLSLSARVLSTDTVTISYTSPAGAKLRSSALTAAASYTDQPTTNNTSATVLRVGARTPGWGSRT